MNKTSIFSTATLEARDTKMMSQTFQKQNFMSSLDLTNCKNKLNQYISQAQYLSKCLHFKSFSENATVYTAPKQENK